VPTASTDLVAAAATPIIAKTRSPMSQVAVLPHQTNGSSAAAASSTTASSHPDIGQLSLHPYGSSRRKSSFSNGSSYRTMPLSRTRSLLANINGVANGVPNGTNGVGAVNGSTGSTANTPGSEANGYAALPSINGSSDHLPPLKASAASVVTANGTSAANNNKFYSNGVTSNGSNGHHNGYFNDMDVMASTVSNVSNVTSVTNGHLAHLNGLQTLPHVRSSANVGGPTSAGTTGGGLPDEVTGVADLDSSEVQKNVNNQIQQQQQQSSQIQQPSSQQNVSQPSVSQNSVQQSPTNSSALSNNAVNSNNTGSLKPKTMVATPEQVMKLYMNKLTPYEHHEIFNYPQIYFIGANAKKRPGIIGGPNNCGYDDDQGSYTHIAHDHLAYRYEVLKVIGKGSFGQVVKAYDHKCHLHVALKMVRNEKRFHRQAQEEIRILEHLRKQDKDNSYNIIHMFDHFVFRSHTCITFELLSINLYELIKKNKFQGFSLQLVRKFAHSLLQCLDLLYRNKIIHCDMKPENVLLKQQGRSGIKVSRPLKNTYFFRENEIRL